MKKPAVLLTGMGTCTLAVTSCFTAMSPTPASQPGSPEDFAQSAPGATASPTIDPDTALMLKNGQSGPSAQSGQEVGSSVIIIVQSVGDTSGETTLTSINEAVASAFPDGYISVGREYRDALKGYALRAPAGSIDIIQAVSGIQAAYPDGNSPLQ